jgi:hypothetical protein
MVSFESFFTKLIEDSTSSAKRTSAMHSWSTPSLVCLVTDHHTGHRCSTPSRPKLSHSRSVSSLPPRLPSRSRREKRWDASEFSHDTTLHLNRPFRLKSPAREPPRKLAVSLVEDDVMRSPPRIPNRKASQAA